MLEWPKRNDAVGLQAVGEPSAPVSSRIASVADDITARPWSVGEEVVSVSRIHPHMMSLQTSATGLRAVVRGRCGVRCDLSGQCMIQAPADIDASATCTWWLLRSHAATRAIKRCNGCGRGHCGHCMPCTRGRRPCCPILLGATNCLLVLVNQAGQMQGPRQER